MSNADDKAISTYSHSEIDRRLKRNRTELQDWLQDGKLPPKRGATGLQKAIRALNSAVMAGDGWAIRMVLEYAIGRPAQYLQGIQEGDEGSADADIFEIRETVSVSRRRRLQKRGAPNGAHSSVPVFDGDRSH